jgi:diketogulonate reductase-like aldo/keto reductase
VEAFERLRAEGKIRHWGVSNLTDDMAELPNGARGCATNQILYNLDHRGQEFDLLPWCADRAIPIMAYSPVGQGGRLLRHPALSSIAARHNATPAQIALAWTLLRPDVISIPKAGDPTHLRQNASLRLSAEDLAEIDTTFPPPGRRQSLAML